MNTDMAHVLVVEDDIPTQIFMKTVLRKEFTVHCVASADEAREALDKQSIHAIIMDISIQGDENGLDLTMDLRRSERWSAIPIIALTAHAFQRDRENAMAAGCSAFITKPFDLPTLITTMKDLILKSLKSRAS